MNPSSHSNSRVNSPQPSVTDIKDLSAEIDGLRDELRTKTSLFVGVQGLFGHFAIIKRAVQSLEHRYENINTADLHAQMVNQLQKMYPNAPAFLEQLKGMQDLVNDNVQRISKIEGNWEPLVKALERALEENEELRGMKTAWESFHDNLQALEQKVTAYTSDGNPSEYMQALSSLQKDIVAGKRTQLEFQTALAAERKDRMQANESLFANNTTLKKLLDESQTKTDELTKSVDQIGTETTELGDSIHRAKEEAKQFHKSVAQVVKDISKQNSYIKGIQDDMGMVDRRVLELSETILLLSGVEKRLSAVDNEVFIMKGEVLQMMTGCRFVLGTQHKMSQFLEDINKNMEHPLEDMNLDAMRQNPFLDKDGNTIGAFHANFNIASRQGSPHPHMLQYPDSPMAPITARRPAAAPPTPGTKPTSTPPNPTLPHPTASGADPTIPSTDANAPSASTIANSQVAPSKKRKRKEKPHVLCQTTFRNAAWTYLHLRLVTPNPAPASPPPADAPSTAEPASADAAVQPPPRNPQPAHDDDDDDADVEPLTVLTLLTPALTAYLGLAGSSVPIDVLRTRRRDVWIRVPRRDARGVRAGLAGWVGVCGGDLVPGVRRGEARVKVAWRVVGEAAALAGVGMGGGGDLFDG
ncbi:hypothetical protein K505DRAFT_380724 [Melanomma pulvis-pyrius CBS 109.77]|uniref:Ribonucleases P/MRP subunit Pop8-like domain-containing protein n=1 Tax=Melanomma pulvis-pyrius CBS 109.77 TaxID=1314802 RepID=A0A6A6WPE4_9PLEO|nr:hypothetical protein K505DRAFT_380724 [Melanomma pulvis-pyrius CBS 109.77]